MKTTGSMSIKQIIDDEQKARNRKNVSNPPKAYAANLPRRTRKKR